MNNKIHTVDYIKRQAKNIKKEEQITHHEALDKAAQNVGFVNYMDFNNKQKKSTTTDTKVEIEISFNEWLFRHKNRNSPLGDLASDAISDSSWPMASDLQSYQNYLSMQGACSGAVDALDRAWKSYKAYIKRQSLPSINKKPSQKKQSVPKGRRVTFVKGVIPLHYSKRTIENFIVGDEAWISWCGKKACPVIITSVSDRRYDVKIERPLKSTGNEHCLFLDEVRSTPELACINCVTS